MDDNKILVKKAAELLGVTPHQIRHLLRENKILGSQNKETGRWLVDKNSLDQYRKTDMYKQDISLLAKEMKITIKDAVEEVEENFDCNLISYISQPNSPVSLINNDDCMLLDDLLYNLKGEYLKGTGEKKYKRIGLFIHSGGGILESAIKFVDIIRQYANEFYVIVPIMAKSAAALMVLNADKQFFTSLTELGPIDPIVQSPANPNLRVPATAIDDYLNSYRKNGSIEIDRVLLEKLDKAIDPFLLGAYKRAMKFSTEEIEKALKEHAMKGKSQEEINKATKAFTTLHKSHGYPIMMTELKDFGIGEKVDESQLKSIKVLMAVYQHFMANSNIVKLIGNREENKNISIKPINPIQQIPTRTSL